MNLYISPDVRLCADGQDFTIEHRKEATEKRPDGYWKRLGHYPTLQMALTRVPDKVILGETADMNVRQIIRALNRINQQIEVLGAQLVPRFKEWTATATDIRGPSDHVTDE